MTPKEQIQGLIDNISSITEIHELHGAGISYHDIGFILRKVPFKLIISPNEKEISLAADTRLNSPCSWGTDNYTVVKSLHFIARERIDENGLLSTLYDKLRKIKLQDDSNTITKAINEAREFNQSNSSGN